MLYIARILDGLTGGNITTAQAYVSDITSEADRAQGLGLLQGAFGVGFIFGPAFGGVLANYGPTVPFIGAAIITSGTFLLTLFTLEESLTASERSSGDELEISQPSLRVLIKQPNLVLILLVTFFATLAFSALPATFALYAERVLFANNIPQERVQLAIGLMLTLHGLLTVITQVGILKPLITRLGELKLLVVGDLALILAMLGVGLANAPLIAVVAFMWAWNEFFAPYLFIHYDELKPITVGLYFFVGDEVTYWNRMSAAGIFAVVPSLIFFLMAQKYIVKGMTAGAVKQ
jgi:DHA1 family tetracycline resistance protein-like MFS transporter